MNCKSKLFIFSNFCFVFVIQKESLFYDKLLKRYWAIVRFDNSPILLIQMYRRLQLPIPLKRQTVFAYGFGSR